MTQLLMRRHCRGITGQFIPTLKIESATPLNSAQCNLIVQLGKQVLNRFQGRDPLSDNHTADMADILRQGAHRAICEYFTTLMVN